MHQILCNLSACLPVGSGSRSTKVHPALPQQPPKFPLSPERRFKVLKPNIATGASATVDLALDTFTGQKVVVKKVKRTEKNQKSLLSEEIIHHKLSQINHPHIARLVDTRHESDAVSFYIEYAEGRDLLESIQPDVGLPVELALHYAHQLFLALEYIHKLGYVHRDVKGENCVLTGDRQALKLIDFGYAVRLSDKAAISKASGTVPYLAPELLGNYCSDLARADCFSAGVVLFTLLTGRFPWARANSSDSEYALFVQGKHSRSEAPRWEAFPPAITALLRDLLTHLPDKRPTAAQAAERIAFMLRAQGA